MSNFLLKVTDQSLTITCKLANTKPKTQFQHNMVQRVNGK